MANKQLEKKTLQEPAEEYLNIRKIPFIHLTTKVVREILGKMLTIVIDGNEGYPDLIIFMGLGKTFFVEFKLPGEDLTDSQKKVFPTLKKRGYEIYVQTDIRDFIKLIEKKRREK